MVVSLLAVCTFIMGYNAIQKGEVAWSRSKTLTGQTAKIIGGVLIVVSLVLGGITIGFSVMNQMAKNNFGTSTASTSTWPN